MAITNETAKKYAKKPAVTCCRFEKGTVISASNLEDPNLFYDLEESGLLTITNETMTIEEVLDATLAQTVDALTPLTAEMVVGAKPRTVEAAPVATAATTSATTDYVMPTIDHASGVFKLHIEEGKNIHLEIPLMAMGQGNVASSAGSSASIAEPVAAKRVMRELVRKHFKIDKVVFGDVTKIDGTTLTIRKTIVKEAELSEELVTSVKLEIITAQDYYTYSETILDVQPIATKESGEVGSGVTRLLDGVVMVVTGTDENGVQIGEFGSSEGELEKNIMWGRPGAPDRGDILIKTEITIKKGTTMERPGPLAAHKASDFITQEIRKALKEVEESLVVNTETFTQERNSSKPKVVIVKEIMGQGAMHDNLILPTEPVGTLGGVPNVDLGNLPVVLSPLEVLDGGIHSLTCIGPASKENSRAYFREPLVIELMNDSEFDLAGVIFVGSPQINAEKFYVSKRLGMTIEAMDVQGAIITTEGFGNNHIDFASHHEEIGKRGVAVVGMTYSAVQGALVVGNEYMTNMIDLNKSKQGIENEILANNTLCEEDAIRASNMLKAVLAGEEILEAERAFNLHVKVNNIEMIEQQTGVKVEVLPNEQSLEKSKKRLELYEAE